MNEKMNLSADLVRIGEWLYQGEDEMAKQFLDKDLKLYKGRNWKVGRWQVDEMLLKIKSLFDQRMKAAEIALTGAEILAS